jgi:hypothetical protein
MTRAMRLLAVVVLAGCAEAAAPTVAPYTGAFVQAVVVARDRGCVPDATVRVVGGPLVHDSLTQVTRCGPWDGDGSSFFFQGLIPGVAVTLRASAPGYVAKEITVLPARTRDVATLIIELSNE